MSGHQTARLDQGERTAASDSTAASGTAGSACSTRSAPSTMPRTTTVLVLGIPLQDRMRVEHVEHVGTEDDLASVVWPNGMLMRADRSICFIQSDVQPVPRGERRLRVLVAVGVQRAGAAIVADRAVPVEMSRHPVG